MAAMVSQCTLSDAFLELQTFLLPLGAKLLSVQLYPTKADEEGQPALWYMNPESPTQSTVTIICVKTGSAGLASTDKYINSVHRWNGEVWHYFERS